MRLTLPHYRPAPFWVRVPAPLAALVLVLAVPALAQLPAPMVSPTPATTPAWADGVVVVVPGQRYAVSKPLRTVLGERYRDLWATPIRVPVVSLQRFAGGLTPVRAHAGSQTRSIRFEGADGRAYQFRSVDKDPVARLAPELRQSLVGKALQDGVSSSHPAASLVTSALLEAAGVLHVKQTLVVLPDDPALGEFRRDFAGLLGMIEERPDERDDDRVSFAGARKVISPTRLFERLDDSPDDRVDARAFLIARLVDMLIGDRDRHRDQFRWATFDEKKVRHWKPVSRDHDEAFVKIDGPALTIARIYYPPLISFGQDYPAHDKLNWHAREVDRRFLVSLDRADWEAVAADVHARLTDEVLDHAVRQMPEEMYAVGGVDLLRLLRIRRDGLVREALSYYTFLTREVEIRATNAAETAEVTRVDDHHVDVVIRERKGNGEPYFRRRFSDRETREIRLKMWGRDDRVTIGGEGRARIFVRVVGGRGDDEVVDSTTTGRVKVYDDSGRNRLQSATGGQLNTKPFQEWVGSDLDRYPPREWGVWWRPLPWFAVDNDFGVLVGGGVVRTAYGFRQSPYASNIDARIGVSSRATAMAAELNGDFRRENSARFWRLRLLASGIEVLRYYGAGNSTAYGGDPDAHRVRMRQYTAAPSAVVPLGRVELFAGPIATYAETRGHHSRFFTDLAPTLYGAGGFGQVGARAGLAVDTRDNAANARRGASLRAEGRLFPAAWDVEEPFGHVTGEAATYVSAARDSAPTVALRVGGQKNWGRFPFQESAFLGGSSTLRGYPQQRFAGDTSLFGGIELRLTAGRTDVAVPAVWGVFVHGDAGRVWVDGQSPGGWHGSAGGGIWFAPFNRANTFRASVSVGRERTTFYLGSGMAF